MGNKHPASWKPLGDRGTHMSSFAMRYQHNDAKYGGRCLGGYCIGAAGLCFYIIVLCHFTLCFLF